jgi:multicomponent Na+:H+ antiporter subunit C
MTILTCIMIGVLFAASLYLMLGGELKEVCMGIFLLGHGANLAVLVASRSPIGLIPPVLGADADLSRYSDPLPQALILTAIVIGFAVQAFLLTLLVVTWRRSRSLELGELANDPH